MLAQVGKCSTRTHHIKKPHVQGARTHFVDHHNESMTSNRQGVNFCVLFFHYRSSPHISLRK